MKRARPHPVRGKQHQHGDRHGNHQALADVEEAERGLVDRLDLIGAQELDRLEVVAQRRLAEERRAESGRVARPAWAAAGEGEF